MKARRAKFPLPRPPFSRAPLFPLLHRPSQVQRERARAPAPAVEDRGALAQTKNAHRRACFPPPAQRPLSRGDQGKKKRRAPAFLARLLSARKKRRKSPTSWKQKKRALSAKRLETRGAKKEEKIEGARKKRVGKRKRGEASTPASASKRAGIIAVGIVMAKGGKKFGWKRESEKGKEREEGKKGSQRRASSPFFSSSSSLSLSLSLSQRRQPNGAGGIGRRLC